MSSISIKRVEPDSSYDFVKRTENLNRYFARQAESIVLADVMKNPVKSENKEKRIKELANLIETDERMKTIKSFMESWNIWRDFYFQLGPIQPKQKGQITAIENAIQFCEENQYDLHMMIGCLHFANLKKKFMPTYSAITTYGEEVYKYYDNVLADLDKSDYQSSSMERAV